MKTFHSLDFESAKKRIEPTIIDEYAVHDEEFENINDIVERAVMTRSKPDFGEKRQDAEYDEFLDDLSSENPSKKIDRTTQEQPSDASSAANSSVSADQAATEAEQAVDVLLQ